MAVTVEARLLSGASPQRVQVTVSGLVTGDVYEVRCTWAGGSYQVAGGEGVSDGAQVVLVDPWAPLRLVIVYTVSVGGQVMAASPSLVPGQILRRNLVTDPRGTTAARWGTGWGVGGNGNETLISGASDGPVLPDGTRATTYVRNTVVVGNTSGSPYVDFNNDPTIPGLPVYPAGSIFAVALYIRVSVASRWAPTTYGRDAEGAVVWNAADGAKVDVAANEWTRIGYVSAPSTAETVGWHARAITTDALPAGTKFEATCALIEPGATEVGPYFDGDTAPSVSGIPAWEGARNASSSVLREALPFLVPSDAEAVLTSLDGWASVPVAAWAATGLPRSRTLRSVAYDVPGRSRPPGRYTTGGHGGGRLAWRIAAQDVPAMESLLDTGEPLVVRSSGARDFPASDLVQVTGESSVLWDAVEGGQMSNARAWDVSYLLVDNPDPSVILIAFAWDLFDDIYAGSTWDSFDAEWAGRTWESFDREDWGMRS